MKLQKVTDTPEPPPAHGRRYRDACGAAYALELVGERWALLILRELMFGPRRFGAIRAGLPAISARVLAERLGELEAAGLLRRIVLPAPGSVAAYELSPWGQAADEPMLALCRWSLRSPGHDPSLFLSPAALMMSLRALFAPAAAAGLALAGMLAVGEDRFVARVAGGALTIARGEEPAADFALAAADARPFLRLFYGKVGLDAAATLGLAVAGDRAAVARFAACVALPPRVA